MGKIIIMKFNENLKYDQKICDSPQSTRIEIGGVHEKMIMVVLFLRLWKKNLPPTVLKIVT